MADGAKTTDLLKQSTGDDDDSKQISPRINDCFKS